MSIGGEINKARRLGRALFAIQLSVVDLSVVAFYLYLEGTTGTTAVGWLHTTGGLVMDRYTILEICPRVALLYQRNTGLFWGSHGSGLPHGYPLITPWQ